LIVPDPAPKIRAALLAVAEAQRVQADALEALAEALTDHQPEYSPAGGDDLLDVRQAAELLAMSASWVYRAVEDGRLPSVRLGTRVRLRREELLASIARRARGTLKEPDART